MPRPQAMRAATWAVVFLATVVIASLFLGCKNHTVSAPTGPISKNQAYIYAMGLAGMTQGQVVLVSDTGSMKPLLDENAVVVYLPSDGSLIRRNDVVLYIHPTMGIPIIHRVAYVNATHFIPEGIANSRNDGFIPRAAIYGRMVGVVYSDGQ